MAEDVSFSNCYIAYIENTPYTLPPDQATHDSQSYTQTWATGWHVLPTMLWKHYITPKNWFHLVHSYEAYTVESTTCTLFNMIPMATQIAIQSTNLFTSFNNCIYAWGYTDDLYETNYHDWWTESLQPNFFYPEGLYTSPNTNSWKRYTFPKYSYRVPLFRVSAESTFGYNQHNARAVFPLTPTNLYTPSGIVWNPLNRPNSLMEFRPGKNAMTFNWHPHDCDKGKWVNLDQLAYLTPPAVTGPYCGIQRPGVYKFADNCDPEILSSQNQTATPENDYTIPNLANQPIVPYAWFLKECQNQIINSNSTSKPHNADPWMKPNLYYNGTEYSLYKYGPMQHFTKLVPLLNETGTNIIFSAQVSVKMTINLKCKKRRSALYCPTDGPYSWRQLYSHTTKDKLFIPAFIRARSGGARFNWQNMTDTNNTITDGHCREDFYTNTTVDAGTGQGQTRFARSIYTEAGQDAKPNLIVTFSKSSDRAVIQPQPPKRSASKMPTVTEAMDIQYPPTSTYM